MVNDLLFDANTGDIEQIAAALGVDPETLPRAGAEHRSGAINRVGFVPLSDDEWSAVSAVLPKLPVPKPLADYGDRTFFDAALWFQAAQARGYSWTRLPQELGPQSSREHRHRRWCLLGYWTDIAEKLATDPRISPDRLKAFQRIAEDAVKRKAMLLERRARLTDGGRAAQVPHFASPFRA